MAIRELDAALDNNPTAKQVEAMAETRIRNLLSFRELEAYNRTGTWLYKHPLIVHRSERSSLMELYKTNPERFLKEYANCAHNVRRYTSYLKNEDRKHRRKADRDLLRKHQDRKVIFENILAENRQ